jgi:hypothetical protein
MGIDFGRRLISRRHADSSRPRFFFVAVLVVFLGTAAPSALFAQAAPRPETRRRVSLGVLIDTSAHQRKVIDLEREAVKSFADGFADLATESFVVGYADEVETLQDWSPLEAGFKTVSARIESSKKRRTLLYDALGLGLSKLESGNSANARVLIVIGEGNDTGSVTRYSEVKKRAKSAQVQCFVLLVASHNLMGGRIRHFGFDLYDLASATNGKAYDVEDSRKNLDKAVRDVVKKVRSRSE